MFRTRMYREHPRQPSEPRQQHGEKEMMRPVGELSDRAERLVVQRRNPEIGSQPSFTPKRIIISKASQKVGMANPVKTATVEIRSKRDPLRTAE